MKKLLTALCVTAAGLLATAHAAAFPCKTVILSGPYSTGTGAGWIVRLSAPRVLALWNVLAVSENNVGASGAIGTLAASKVASNGQLFR